MLKQELFTLLDVLRGFWHVVPSRRVVSIQDESVDFVGDLAQLDAVLLQIELRERVLVRLFRRLQDVLGHESSDRMLFKQA